MRVLLLHNRYAQRAGEDRAFDLQRECLRKAGIDVDALLVDSRELDAPARRLRAALRASWNPDSVAAIERRVETQPVDLAHVHNFFPILSPSAHATLRRLGVPVVQTLHSQRLHCANGLFLREGRGCLECVEHGPWHAVRHGCYRGSRSATAVWAHMAWRHGEAGRWPDLADCFVAPSEYAARRAVGAGLEPGRLRVVPNLVPDPGPPSRAGRGAVFVGRLAAEKGVRLLLDAWRRAGPHELLIVGSGPEEAALRRLAAGGSPRVRFAGELPPEGVQDALRGAALLVAPSLAGETFGMSVAEAMAAGRAVVAPRDSAPGELVLPGLTGRLFEPGDPHSLAEACRSVLDDPSRARAMGAEARQRFEETLAPAAVTGRLLDLYRELARCS
jgi:glycosyltransferase involved in cell wall biosynthesis